MDKLVLALQAIIEILRGLPRFWSSSDKDDSKAKLDEKMKKDGESGRPDSFWKGDDK